MSKIQTNFLDRLKSNPIFQKIILKKESEKVIEVSDNKQTHLNLNLFNRGENKALVNRQASASFGEQLMNLQKQK